MLWTHTFLPHTALRNRPSQVRAPSSRFLLPATHGKEVDYFRRCALLSPVPVERPRCAIPSCMGIHRRPPSLYPSPAAVTHIHRLPPSLYPSPAPSLVSIVCRRHCIHRLPPSLVTLRIFTVAMQGSSPGLAGNPRTGLCPPRCESTRAGASIVVIMAYMTGLWRRGKCRRASAVCLRGL